MSGLSEKEVNESRTIFGSNVSSFVKTRFSFSWLFKSPQLSFLLALVTILCINFDFLSLIFLMIGVFVPHIIEYFLVVNIENRINSIDDEDRIKVFRDGKLDEVRRDELVVGDIVLLMTGDTVPAQVQINSLDDVELKFGSVITNEEYTNNIYRVVGVGCKDEEVYRVEEESSKISYLPEAYSIAVVVFCIIGGLLQYLLFGFPISKIILILVSILYFASLLDFSRLRYLRWLYSFQLMRKSGVLVKSSSALEKLGNITLLFCGSENSIINPNSYRVVSENVINRRSLCINACLNSKAYLGRYGKILGNPVDGAVLKHLNNYVDGKVDDIRKNYLIANRNKYSVLCINPSFNEETYTYSLHSDDNQVSVCYYSGIGNNFDGVLKLDYDIQPGIKDYIELIEANGVDILLFSQFDKKIIEEMAHRINLNEGNIWALDLQDFSKYAWGDPHCGYPNVLSYSKLATDEDICRGINRIVQEFKVSLSYNDSVIGYVGSGNLFDLGFIRADVKISLPQDSSYFKNKSDIVLDCSPNSVMKSISEAIRFSKFSDNNIKTYISLFLTFYFILSSLVLFELISIPIFMFLSSVLVIGLPIIIFPRRIENEIFAPILKGLKSLYL